jgi:hypothetical protein
VGNTQSPFDWLQLRDGAAIDLHRKHNLLEPSLYFGIDFLDGYSNKAG